MVVHLEKLFFYEGAEVPEPFYAGVEASSGGYYRIVRSKGGHQSQLSLSPPPFCKRGIYKRCGTIFPVKLQNNSSNLLVPALHGSTKAEKM